MVNAHTPLVPGRHPPPIRWCQGVQLPGGRGALVAHSAGHGRRNCSSVAYFRRRFSKLTLWSFAVCGELNGQQAITKYSGKNPDWSDGIGGSRFK